jgi:hypothetical protein
LSLRTIPGFAQSRNVAALKLLDLLSELLQLGITNAEHFRAGVILFTFAFHTSLRKSMFSIVVETKRSRIHCKSNQAAERNMIARRLCWGRPEVGQCPVRSTYLVFPTPQRNSAIKLDVGAAG